MSELENRCLCDVDEESFAACNNHLSEYVIFQARLSGTASNSSEYLISRLKEWVSTSPLITVSSLRMEVANDELNCMILVLGFDEENCLTDINAPVDTTKILAIVLTPTVTVSLFIVGVILSLVGKCIIL